MPSYGDWMSEQLAKMRQQHDEARSRDMGTINSASGPLQHEYIRRGAQRIEAEVAHSFPREALLDTSIPDDMIALLIDGWLRDCLHPHVEQFLLSVPSSFMEDAAREVCIRTDNVVRSMTGLDLRGPIYDTVRECVSEARKQAGWKDEIKYPSEYLKHLK